MITGCRGGTIKLWSTESCSLVGEMKGIHVFNNFFKCLPSKNFFCVEIQKNHDVLTSPSFNAF